MKSLIAAGLALALCAPAYAQLVIDVSGTSGAGTSVFTFSGEAVADTQGNHGFGAITM